MHFWSTYVWFLYHVIFPENSLTIQKMGYFFQWMKMNEWIKRTFKKWQMHNTSWQEMKRFTEKKIFIQNSEKCHNVSHAPKALSNMGTMNTLR